MSAPPGRVVVESSTNETNAAVLVDPSSTAQAQ
jgi:hypothetical protein